MEQGLTIEQSAQGAEGCNSQAGRRRIVHEATRE
jgi:hypothetical protein